jgi:predicted XRE-type DNA-binding protein
MLDSYTPPPKSIGGDKPEKKRNGRKPRSNEEIFWSHVTPGEPDECWIWQAGRRGDYGSGYYNGKRESAHRVSYILFKGPIPDGLEVCHTCDVKLCVNPNHLWVGTHQQNILDIKAKGTRSPAYGEAHGKSKLTSQQVAQVPELIKQGMSQRQIGKLFGVSSACISYISRGITRRYG